MFSIFLHSIISYSILSNSIKVKGWVNHRIRIFFFTALQFRKTARTFFQPFLLLKQIERRKEGRSEGKAKRKWNNLSPPNSKKVFDIYRRLWKFYSFLSTITIHLSVIHDQILTICQKKTFLEIWILGTVSSKARTKMFLVFFKRVCKTKKCFLRVDGLWDFFANYSGVVKISTGGPRRGIRCIGFLVKGYQRLKVFRRYMRCFLTHLSPKCAFVFVLLGFCWSLSNEITFSSASTKFNLDFNFLYMQCCVLRLSAIAKPYF